jgi:hypothetical protein
MEVRGYKIEQGADLSGANLSGATIGDHKLASLKGRAARSDGYEFLIFKTEGGEGNVIRAGCRTMTLRDYAVVHVMSYSDVTKREETLDILEFLKKQLERGS